MRRLIIAIQDNVAQDIMGPLQIHVNEAAAMRFFADVATHPESQVARHIDDYDLVLLGILDDDITIISEKKTIITGTQFRVLNAQHEQAANA